MGMAAVFLAVALLAAGLGLTGVTGDLAAVAWVVAFVFAILFVATTVSESVAGRRRSLR